MAAGLALGTYLGVAAILGQVGYPLDDAWIHQTYARSLALRGEWAYWPGEVSAGSTSPLWTILLIPGQLIPNGMFFWTFMLGGLDWQAVPGWRNWRINISSSLRG